jgi:precorrin-4 methylase
MSLSSKIFTYTLTSDTLVIQPEYGLKAVSVKLTSGTGSILGTMRVGNLSSSAIPLTVGEGVTINSDEASGVIQDLTIDASSGTILIIGRS